MIPKRYNRGMVKTRLFKGVEDNSMVNSANTLVIGLIDRWIKVESGYQVGAQLSWVIDVSQNAIVINAPSGSCFVGTGQALASIQLVSGVEDIDSMLREYGRVLRDISRGLEVRS